MNRFVVRLRPEAAKCLIRLAITERRQAADQAAVLLEQVLSTQATTLTEVSHEDA